MSLAWLLDSVSSEELRALNLAPFVICSKFLLELLPKMFCSFLVQKGLVQYLHGVGNVIPFVSESNSASVETRVNFVLNSFFLVVSSNGKCLGVTLIDGKSCCLQSEFTRWKFTQLINCFIYCNPNKRENCAAEAV